MFIIFIFALWSFDFFQRQMMLLRQQQSHNDELNVPDWLWMTVGYTVFIWSALVLIRVSETNPDMLVAAFFYMASGLLLRIRRDIAGWWSFTALGLVLGLGYLTKAVIFPVSVLCLGAAALLEISSHRGIFRVAVSALVFVLIAAPLIVALSIKLNKPTFGESATYNTILDVDHAPRCFPICHWEDEGAYGKLLHPPQEIFDRPNTYAYTSSIGGSYPFWYDPSYWFQGVRPYYDVKSMAKNAATNLKIAAPSWVFGLNGSIVAGLFVMFYVSGRRWRILKDVGAFWFLLLPSLLILAAYSTLHIEYRYIGGFVVVIISCLFFSVHLPPTTDNRSLFSGVALLLFLMLTIPFGPDQVHKHLSSLLDLVKPITAVRNPNAEVVRGLERMGLRPGDPVASLQFSNCAIQVDTDCEGSVFWARLGRFRIVAEVDYYPEQDATRGNNFWDADPERQEKVIRALASTGARVVVSRLEPRGSGAGSWRKIGDTDYYARWLEPMRWAS
jgi:hypothetical protein